MDDATLQGAGFPALALVVAAAIPTWAFRARQQRT